MPKLKRPCLECGDYFIPDGKYTKYCDKCFYKKRKIKKWRGLIEDEYQLVMDKLKNE